MSRYDEKIVAEPARQFCLYSQYTVQEYQIGIRLASFERH